MLSPNARRESKSGDVIKKLIIIIKNVRRSKLKRKKKERNWRRDLEGDRWVEGIVRRDCWEVNLYFDGNWG